MSGIFRAVPIGLVLWAALLGWLVSPALEAFGLGGVIVLVLALPLSKGCPHE
jgi:hypothetical protein